MLVVDFLWEEKQQKKKKMCSMTLKQSTVGLTHNADVHSNS